MIGEIAFRAMGCQVRAVLDTPDPQAVKVLRDVPGWFAAWEQRFSRFRPDSELSEVNRRAGHAVEVSQAFGEVFELSRQAAAWTGGLVTPTVHDALLTAGYRRSFEDLSFEGPGAPAPEVVPGLEAVEWDPARRILKLPAGLHLDFGGSAKGWAAEQAMNRLQAFGDALVDAGGDIALSPLSPAGETRPVSSWRRDPWPVGVAKPFEAPPALITTLALWGGGVATSGQDRRRWKQDGAWQHHLIDPRSGYPAVTDVITATVVAPRLAQAEAAAKCVLLSGSQAGLAWLAQNPGLAALLVLDDGRIVSSPNYSAYEREESRDAIQN